MERDEEVVFGADNFPVGEGEEVFDVGGGEPIRPRRGGAEAEPAGEGKQRTPKIGVEVDDEPGFRGSDGVCALEQSLRVDGVVERFGNNDDVEWLRQIEVFTGLDVESRVGQASLGARDLTGSQVDASDVAVG